MMDAIFTRAPINRSAAAVTSQAGVSDVISMDDERDCLVGHVEYLRRELNGLPKKHRNRLDLGNKIRAINLQLSELNKKIKKAKAQDRDLDKYIIEVLKKNLTKAAWNEALCAARSLKNERVKLLGGDK